jgi:hypothetical protein
MAIGNFVDPEKFLLSMKELLSQSENDSKRMVVESR